MTILVHEGKEENLDQTWFCISLRFTHMLIPLRLVYFSVSANKHASVHVAHVNNLHWSVFHMKYLPSNILHVRRNGILSNIRTTSLSAIFSSGPKGESPIFWCGPKGESPIFWCDTFNVNITELRYTTQPISNPLLNQDVISCVDSLRLQ